jgi:hypothetical protein
MKLTAVVVLLALVSVALAADVDEVSEDSFTSEEAVKTVHSVNVEMNPKAAIPATIVEHLPSHDNEASEESKIQGNAFETSNFEADVVDAKDSLVASEGFTEAEEVDADAADARFSSQPIRQLKALLEMKAAPAALPSMNSVPPKADKPKIDIDALAERAPPGQKVLDPEAARASALYLGYEDPNHLPVGGLKIPVDYSGTIGTEAGNKFNYPKALKNEKLRAAGKRVKYKRCANGCTVRTPVMVGYRGVKEWPARLSRRVRTPGDKQRIRQIHTDLKTTKRTSWKQAHLNEGRAKLRKSSRTINNLRRKRKEYENTPLKIPVSKW